MNRITVDETPEETMDRLERDAIRSDVNAYVCQCGHITYTANTPFFKGQAIRIAVCNHCVEINF